MKFSEIKHKIKNLGNFKSLEEIKKAGLRIVRNTKTGDYWLIEEEFLKPVIKSPRECKTILIKPENLKYKVLMVHKSKEELKGKKVLDYIEWGEKQGFHKRPTCKSRKWWWSIEQKAEATNFFQLLVGDRFISAINYGFYADTEYYIVLYKGDKCLMGMALNSTITKLQTEFLGRPMIGAITGMKLQVYEVEDIYIINPVLLISQREKIMDIINNLGSRMIKNFLEELGFDPNKPIREQEPNPLPDRKALDDIVFDALGLTEEERKEVYWAVAELVQNRLKKAKSV